METKPLLLAHSYESTDIYEECLHFEPFQRYKFFSPKFNFENPY